MDVSLWNALLEACKESGQFQQGYELFEGMKASGETPNLTTFNTMASLAAKAVDVSISSEKCPRKVKTAFPRSVSRVALMLDR